MRDARSQLIQEDGHLSTLPRLTPNRPLLSVCIPTYNRSRVLEAALRALGPQIQATCGEVELVVSDNCSTDETQVVVEKAQKKWGQLRYHRNETNLGVAGNILKLTHELATGEFGWVIGDDDIVLPNGVNRVLHVIKSHPEIDYIFVNTATKLSSERETCEKRSYSPNLLDLSSTVGNGIRPDRNSIRCEELLDPDIDHGFFGSVMCSVYRLSRFRQYRPSLMESAEIFPSLEKTYPTAVVLAHTTIGRPAYYIGTPCVIAFFGEQEWLDQSALLVLVRLQELLDLYERSGVHVERVERCRRDLLLRNARSLQHMLFYPNTPGRAEFSIRKFLWRNRKHPWALARVIVWVILSSLLRRSLFKRIWLRAD